MPFFYSENLHARLVAALQAKTERIKPCPVCGQDREFQLFYSNTNVPMMRDATTFSSEAYVSCLVLMCNNCGCMHFLNANILGVRDLISAANVELQQAALEEPPTSEPKLGDTFKNG